MVRNKSIGSRITNAINYTVLGLLCVVTLYPFWNSFVLSISSRASLVDSVLKIWPTEISLDPWIALMNSSFMWSSFMRSVVRTAAGTAFSLACTVAMAYSLSKARLPHRKAIMVLVTFTMLFNGGLIPTYMLVNNLGLINSTWALILPALVSPFNLIIVKNFFQSLSPSLEEAAILEGANDMYFFWKIALPLSKPIIATITLWLMVDNWNSWFDAAIYINDRSKFLLQQVLQEMVAQVQIDASVFQTGNLAVPPLTESVQAATTLFVTLPILLVYPFIQKYFTQGIMIGSLKE